MAISEQKFPLVFSYKEYFTGNTAEKNEFTVVGIQKVTKIFTAFFETLRILRHKDYFHSKLTKTRGSCRICTC